MQYRADVLTDVRELDEVRAAWDDLARVRQMPFSASSWGLAWWRHAAPEGAQLRVIVVRDDLGVVCVAPLYCRRTGGTVRYGFLGDAMSSPLLPVWREGGLDGAASSVAAALASCSPRPDVLAFCNIPERSSWPDLIRAHWPGRGRPLSLRRRALATPYIELDGTYEQWLAGQSRNFRQQLRRHRRRLEERGAVFRMVTDPEELDDRLDDFARLHHARFEGRGGSAVLDMQRTAVLRAAGAEMLADGGFQLWLIDVDGKVVSAHLLMAAGGRVSYWLGGFDDDWGREQPALQTLAAALEYNFAAGRRLFDLGPGLQDYKTRFSKHTAQGVDVLMLMPGPRRAIALTRDGGRWLRRETVRRARRAVPQEVKDTVRRWIAVLTRRRVGDPLA